MANWIEKHMPKKLREKMTTLIVTALGLFLALQYNETIKAILETYFPLNSNNLVGRIIYVFVLTCVIVYASYLVEKSLDGK